VQQTTPGTLGSVGMEGGWRLSMTTTAAAAVAVEGVSLEYLLGKASKIWEVGSKLIGSR
jgi:hypothetical protein